MVTLLCKRGRENVVHKRRVFNAALPRDTLWDAPRLIIFAARIGAKKLPDADIFEDAFGWQYRIGELN